MHSFRVCPRFIPKSALFRKIYVDEITRQNLHRKPQSSRTEQNKQERERSTSSCRREIVRRELFVRAKRDFLLIYANWSVVDLLVFAGHFRSDRYSPRRDNWIARGKHNFGLLIISSTGLGCRLGSRSVDREFSSAVKFGLANQWLLIFLGLSPIKF